MCCYTYITKYGVLDVNIMFYGINELVCDFVE